MSQDYDTAERAAIQAEAAEGEPSTDPDGDLPDLIARERAERLALVADWQAAMSAGDFEAAREATAGLRAMLPALTADVQALAEGDERAITQAEHLVDVEERRARREADAEPLTAATIPEHPDPPVWLVPDWLPAARLAFLSGRGGVGKSRLALQLAAALAAGEDGPCRGFRWLPGPGREADGLRIARGGPVVLATWEDDPQTVGWRLRRIFDAMQLPEDRVRERLHLVDLAALGPVWSPAAGAHVSTMAALTAIGAKLRRFAEARGAALLILDPLAAAYAANENDRGLVRQFMASWDAWARASHCAVLLIAHPAKASAGEAADYSGSTDWRNAARAAWKLDLRPSPDAPTGRGAPADRWPCLTLDKSSYGPLPDPRWLEAEATVWREIEAPTNGGGDFGGVDPDA